MSNPTWPVITFRVNLETLHRYDWSLPYNTQLVGNETVTEANQMKNTRSSWLCSMFPGFEFVFKKTGVEFTAYGQKAQYLKNLYVTGAVDDVLTVVS